MQRSRVVPHALAPCSCASLPTQPALPPSVSGDKEARARASPSGVAARSGGPGLAAKGPLARCAPCHPLPPRQAGGLKAAAGAYKRAPLSAQRGAVCSMRDALMHARVVCCVRAVHTPQHHLLDALRPGGCPHTTPPAAPAAAGASMDACLWRVHSQLAVRCRVRLHWVLGSCTPPCRCGLLRQCRQRRRTR